MAMIFFDNQWDNHRYDWIGHIQQSDNSYLKIDLLQISEEWVNFPTWPKHFRYHHQNAVLLNYLYK